MAADILNFFDQHMVNLQTGFRITMHSTNTI